jgi:carbon monoxide dehydrogenase subunit G
MELNGEVLIAATRAQVWAALNDAAVLQACIPGCEEIVNETESVRRARVMVKLGPVRARFSGTLTLSEVTVPERCLMRFEGSGGAAGMASGRSQVELFEQGDQTRLTYTVAASVGGKLGQIGGRLLDASARQLADQFFAALRERLAGAAATGAALDPVQAAGPMVAEQGIESAHATSSQPASAPEQTLATPTADAPVVSTPVTNAGAVSAPVANTLGTQAPSGADPAVPLPRHQPGRVEAEFSRLLWFLMGVGSTAIGVWIGARWLSP